MHEYKTAEAPEILETLGLGPCIGVAIAHEEFGFLLHSVDVIMESNSVVDPFFAAIKSRIPLTDRAANKPVVAGGCLGVFTGAEDVETEAQIIACRKEILKRLTISGFSKPVVCWGRPYHNQSLFIDTEKRVIFLETIDERDLDALPHIKPFKY